ncbi:MAG TPA: hypothetical protein VJR92_08170 [Gemmatimonadaceae bacterium]|nr:hypothetical protein [Gemmatimonadaceae bacterium]
MKSLVPRSESVRAAVTAEAPHIQRSSSLTPVATGLNTILAVREHAPAEIEELETEIRHWHQKLGAAYARKRLLEQLLVVIHEADAERAAQPVGMAVVR